MRVALVVFLLFLSFDPCFSTVAVGQTIGQTQQQQQQQQQPQQQQQQPQQGEVYTMVQQGPTACDEEMFMDKNLTCQPCPEGFTVPEPSSTATTIESCSACRRGKFWDKTRKICDDCPVHLTTDGIDKLSLDDCVLCAVGYYGESQKCTLCPHGWSTTAPDQHKLDNCTQCAVGFYMSNQNCVQCPYSRSTPSVGGLNPSDCTVCGAGFYGNTQQTVCKPCPLGMMSEPGATECTNCPVGKYSSDPATICVDCPVNTYADVEGLSECLACPERKYVDTVGATKCNRADDIPTWLLKVFVTMLLLFTLTALYTRIGMKAQVNKKWLPKNVTRLHFSIYVLLSLATFQLGLPTPNADRDPTREASVIAIAIVIIVFCCFLRINKGKNGDLLEQIPRNQLVWTVLCSLVLVMAQFRLLGSREGQGFDVPLLLCVYFAVQIQVTFLFGGLEAVGANANRIPLYLVVFMCVVVVVLPLSILRAGIEADEQAWEEHDYENVHLVNALFGLFTTGILFVVRILNTVKIGNNKAMGKIKSAAQHLTELGERVGQLSCKTDMTQNNPTAVSTRHAVINMLNEMGEEMTEDETPLVCKWLQSYHKKFIGSHSGVLAFLLRDKLVTDSSKNVLSICEGKLSNTVVNQLKEDSVAKKSSRIICSELRQATLELRMVLDQLVSDQRNVPESVGQVSYFLSNRVSDLITTQLLIATGFYSATTGLAQLAHSIRHNYQGKELRLYAFILVFILTIIALAIAWLFSQMSIAKQLAKTDRIKNALGEFASECERHKCKDGYFFSYDCDSYSDGCARCSSGNCGGGQVFHTNLCGTEGHIDETGCLYA